MPEKTVAEMNRLERAHYSLAAQVFHSVLNLSIVLGVAALLIGLALYAYTQVRQYASEAFGLARTSALVVQQVADTDAMADEVMAIYHGMTDDERAMTGTDEYAERFASVRDTEQYAYLRAVLKAFRDESDVNDFYFGVYDAETCALVYICDPDDSEETGFEAGEWEPLEKRELEKFLSWDGTGKLYDISKTEKYGWLCTAGVPLRNEAGEICGFLLSDVTLADVAAGMRAFTLFYTLVMLVLINLLCYLLTQRMKRKVVAPINAIADAAENYVADRRAGKTATDHFAMLNIRTGDEVENLSLVMADMERELADYEDDLTRITAEKERIGTELSLASRIQADMLPNIFPAFPERRDIDIYASMNPAKEVGGDFYDFFLIDNDHLAMVMADVSGKGVPAALFMMISKILIQNFAMLGRTPAGILEAVNDRICSNNREEMFVTVWLGVLDLKTGVLKAANAGHEYPAVRQPGGDFELFRDKHGFVIGGMADVRYRDYELVLEPGARLFVYTDGVPEATDTAGALFGTERMLSALREAQEGDSETILRSVHKAVTQFSGTAPQFDDITMLCLQYLGPDSEEDGNVKELTVEATAQNIETITDFINAELEALDCPVKAQMQIDVVIDEIVANVAAYAYGNGIGEVTVRFEAHDDPRAAVLSFIDSGVPFNPLAKEDPNIRLAAEDRAVGGLGIFLVKKTMDDVAYEYKDGKNILRIKKLL